MPWRSAAFLAALLTGLGVANAAPEAAKTVLWKDLRPAAQPAAQTFSRPMIAALLPDHGETLAWNAADETVELKGYALPVDRDGDLVYQFLLVPWTGACSHMPTPPPNQIVLVTLPKPYRMEKAYQTVAVTGRLKPDMEKSQLFITDGVTVIQSGYAFSGAEVADIDSVPETVELQQANPWKFLKK
ncbi:DUF3299 domain-containing protein [Ollibium composti]|uniref:DUF3299 domain-containing protein n=1 Tax=Ollibium composti TaxID=2675109 RepID=A0ABY2QCA5_9HYPH|nr:DUF3299 domain-containing protein [Mesorhizobium composti]THF59907.1 DUF3299 domain-containing protein [Mesorhizobium composti]